MQEEIDRITRELGNLEDAAREDRRQRVRSRRLFGGVFAASLKSEGGQDDRDNGEMDADSDGAHAG